MQSNSTSQQSAVVLIEPGQEPAFRKRLESLNKKAKAYGLEPIAILSATTEFFERKVEQIGRSEKLLSYLVPAQAGGTRNPIQLKRFRIEYPTIKLGNWQVVGKVEAFEGGNLQFQVTQEVRDTEAIANFASRPIGCQHCNTKRRRKDGFVLRDQSSDAYMQVGGSCLQDFTGIDPAAALFLAKMWDVLRAEEDDLREFLGSGRRNAISTREYLAGVCFLAATSGFVSAAKARELGIPATYQEVPGLFRTLMNDEKLRQQYCSMEEKHLATADAIQAWAAELPETSSFNANLRLLLKEDALALDPKHLAFAAASWAMYTKATAEKRDIAISRHVGAPGEKMTRQLTVHRTVPLETPYGVSILVLLRDMDGNHLTWKTSACPRALLDFDDEPPSFEASFKVKKHETYKGLCQTAITHLKVLGMAEVAQAA